MESFASLIADVYFSSYSLANDNALTMMISLWCKLQVTRTFYFITKWILFIIHNKDSTVDTLTLQPKRSRKKEKTTNRTTLHICLLTPKNGHQIIENTWMTLSFPDIGEVFNW